jgi:hypothetical protein
MIDTTKPSIFIIIDAHQLNGKEAADKCPIASTSEQIP